MLKPDKEKNSDITLLIKDREEPEVEKEITDNQTFAYTSESLMPELEELVKKNPNRLIGCGG